MKLTTTISTVLITLAAICLPAVASAHVVVTPGQANVASEQLFTISSPNEGTSALTAIRIEIPKGVTAIVPTTQPGWTAELTGGSDSTGATSITWRGGEIPVGQRLDFSFEAQVPASAGSIAWKAYQTYADGSVVHWDQKPAGGEDANCQAGPYTTTRILDDLSGDSKASVSKSSTTLPIVLSILALVISGIGLAVHRQRN